MYHLPPEEIEGTFLNLTLQSDSHFSFLQCRPLPANGDKRCQRCAEANLQCIFVPVSSAQPMSTSSTQQQFQFRVDPSTYDPAYGNFTWEEQHEVALNDPAPGMSDVRGPDQRAPSMHGEYANASLHSSTSHSSSYQFPPSGWQSGYPGQPQGIIPPPGDVSSPNTDPMQYHIHNTSPIWSGNSTQHQFYPPYDMNR